MNVGGQVSRGQDALRDAVTSIRTRGLRHWLIRERVIGLRMIKTSLAAALAWELAQLLPGQRDPLLAVLAPLVAIVAVQVTIYQSMRSGLQQLGAGIVGLGFALLLGHTLGLHAWTIGLIIFFSLLLGSAVRLHQQSSQVAITALLVVLLGSQYGTIRLFDTLLGAAVGIAVNIAVVPPLYTQSASEALTNLAEDLADLLRAMGEGLTGGRDQASRWLKRARELDRDVEAARGAIMRGEESARFNPRWLQARSARADHRRRLETLDRVATEVRGMARAMADLAEGAPVWRANGVRPSAHAQLGDLLCEIAGAMDLYAEMLRGGPSETASRQKLDAAVASSHQLRRRIAGRLYEQLAEEPAAWPVYGSLLADATRILHEIETEQGHVDHAGRTSGLAPLPLARRLGRRVRRLDHRVRGRRRGHRPHPIGIEKS